MSRNASLSKSLGVGTKFVLVNAVVSITLALILTAVATNNLQENLVSRLIGKGEGLALSVAVASRTAGVSAAALQPLLDTFRDSENVSYLYVVDGSGRVLAHTLSESPSEQLLAANVLTPGETLPEGQRVKRGDVDVRLADGQHLRALDVAAPLSGGRGVVHVGLLREATESQVLGLWGKMMLLALVLVAGGVAAAAVLGRTIVRPLRELTAAAAHIVESGDLTRPIHVAGGDEVGQLAQSFSMMVERLRNVTVNLQQAAEALMASTENLNASSTQQSQAISRQAAALQETQVTAQEIRQTSLLASQKAESVLAVAERADELSRAGEAALEQTLTGLNDIRSQVQEIAQKILELGERTQQIGDITQTVKDLADQSNMLALNAAIEAVRSGENGKGFGVVAREIRALADQSIESTARVRELLDDITASVGHAVRITERGSQRMEAGLEQVRSYGKNLHELSTIVQDNTASVRQIAAAVNQQNLGISQITTAVNDLSKMMDEAVVRIGATGEAASTLQIISDQLSSAVKSYRVQ